MNKEILSGDSLYRDVITYSQMGEHRTATEGDLRTSEWIAEHLEEAGLATCFQTFSLRQFFVHETSLVVAGERINCFPLWFPRGTGPQPVRAQLAAFGAGSDGQKDRIALVKLPFRDRGITLVKSFKDGATSPDEADVVEETILTPIYKDAEAGALAVVAIR